LEFVTNNQYLLCHIQTWSVNNGLSLLKKKDNVTVLDIKITSLSRIAVLGVSVDEPLVSKLTQ